MSAPLDDELLWSTLSDRIASTIGLNFPPQRHADLKRGVVAAARELGIDDVPVYARRLLAHPLSGDTLQLLVRHLTIGETYFFRDEPSMAALASTVLPQLAKEARSRGRRLRLWSAACCTGEEAYTLAILLHRLLPESERWDARVLASDVNAAAIERAREGIYGEWAFRGTPPWLKPLYFERLPDGRYRLASFIRERVDFSVLNLVDLASAGAPAAMHNLDLVLCRNVLMYFSAAQTVRVMAALSGTLAEGGWLMTGSAEGPLKPRTGLSAMSIQGAILFRKTTDRSGAPPPCVSEGLAPPSYVAMSGAPPPLPPLKKHLPIEAPPMPLAEERPPVGAALSIAEHARADADQGRLDEALVGCDRWIAERKLDPAAHYTRAMVLIELGRPQEARASLQRVVYLDEDFVLAHFALGTLAVQRGQPADAARHFANTRRSLAPYAADALLPESRDLTADALRQTLQALLGSSVAPDTLEPT